jgi:hypothetical protein
VGLGEAFGQINSGFSYLIVTQMLRPNTASGFGIRIINFGFYPWGWAKHSDR